MNVRPIRTVEDLLDRQERVASLIRRNDSGQYDDEIEVLSTLIVDFERRTFDLRPPDAISAIKFRMAEMGLTQRQLEPYIGSRARVYEILSGKRSLSMDMIRSLHDGLGIPYASLIGDHRISNKSSLEAAPPTLARLNALGFEVDMGNVSSFVHASLKTTEALALLRKTRTTRAASKTDRSALVLWQAAVLRKAEGVPPKSIGPSSLDEARLRSVARLSTKSLGPVLALQKLAELGVKVVIVPALPGTFLDGAAMLSTNGIPIVALTLRHDRVDNFWFTLFHEIAHVHLHKEHLRLREFVFFDDMEMHTDDALEREADLLARQTLIPDAILQSVRWDPKSSLEDIVAVATRARVHQAIVAGRWQKDHQNYRRFSRLIERDSLRAILLRKFR